MGMSEADTRAELIDPIIRTKGWVFPYFKREESGRAVDIVDGQPRQRSTSYVDYTLRVDVNAETQSVAVALIEAKAEDLSPDDRERLMYYTFYGREKENLIFPITLANLILHGIDQPNLWHGNTLTGGETYGGLFQDAPAQFNVILTNPPFGGKEAQTTFAYKTGATQVLFLQHVIDRLANGGRCGIVMDEGVLFRTNEIAFVQTKRKLLNDCDVWCIVSLPGGMFTAAGAGVKTNLVFFTKGQPTEKIWYYDLSDVKVAKKSPFTRALLEDFFRLLPTRADSERSWTVTRTEIEAKNFDLKAVNPNAKSNADTRTPEELLNLIEAKGREVTEALAVLRKGKV